MAIKKFNKKGNLLSIIMIMVIVLVVGIVVVFGNMFMSRFNSALDDKVEKTPEMIATEERMEQNFLLFDNAILMLVILMTTVLIITSFLIPTHPVFLIINIFGIFILVFGGMVMNNIYGEIVTTNLELENTALNYPKINFIINYLPYISAILVAIFSIVMYTRSSGGGGY